MKSFLILLLASQLSFAADSSFDEIAKKITSPNVNVINAFKEAFKAIDELKQNKDSSKELVLFKSFTDSSICLKNFSNEVRDKKYSELLEGMQKKNSFFSRCS